MIQNVTGVSPSLTTGNDRIRLSGPSSPKMSRMISALIMTVVYVITSYSIHYTKLYDGIGFARYKNGACYVAVIVEVEIGNDISVKRAWA